MENLDKALGEVVAKLGELAEKHGPDAINLAGYVYQMEYMGLLLRAVFFIAAFAVLTPIFLKCVKEENKSEDVSPWFGGVLVTGGAGLVSLVGALICTAKFLINPVVWAAASDPRVAIAAKVLSNL